jgi:stage V sporulation protein G
MSNNKLDVRVYPIDEPKGNTVAFASVAVDDVVAIRGVRVIDGEKGLFMSMPQSKDKDGEYHDIAFPLTADLRKELGDAVIGEYIRVSRLEPEQRGYGAYEMAEANARQGEEIKFDARVYPLDKPQGSTKAFASVSIEDAVAIRGIRVIDGEKGMFINMPQSKDKDGEYHDIAFPLNGDLRREISKALIAGYENAEKNAEKSLANGLRKGAEQAAEHNAAPRETAAKSRSAGMLE